MAFQASSQIISYNFLVEVLLRRDEHRGAGKGGGLTPTRGTGAFGGWWPCQGHWDEYWHCHMASDPRRHQPTGAAGHPTKQHLLVESLVLNPTLPEVFAGFWCRGKIGENNFLLLKETDRESGGEQGVVLIPQTRNGVDRAGEWHWHRQVLLCSHLGCRDQHLA